MLAFGVFAAIVGNGPSRDLWDGRGFSIGSNAAKDTNVVVITDPHVVDKICDGQFRPACPVILGPRAWEHAMHRRSSWRKIKVVGVVTKSASKNVQNAGQVGALWALRCGFLDVHLFGFDSLWTRNRESLTDAIWPKKDPTNPDKPPPNPMNKWDNGWKNLWLEYPKAELTVHAPAEVEWRERKHFVLNTKNTNQ